MESSEFISVEQALSDLVTACNDEGYTRSGLDKGFYISRIHGAVTYFGLETFYQTVVKDINNFDRSGVISIPVNAFNIREIYLYNISNEEVTDIVTVHWKRNLAYGTSKARTSRIRKNTNDPVDGGGYFDYKNRITATTPGLITANIQSGRIILDGEYDSYSGIRIIYNGMGSKNGDIPCIPRIIYDGILDKAKLDTFEYLKVRDKSFRVDYQDSYSKFFGYGRAKGTLLECKRRISSMDKFQRDSMMEYFSNADYNI